MNKSQTAAEPTQTGQKPKIKRTFYITEELWTLTSILAHKKPFNGSQSAVIQAALRAYIDQQDDIIGSRAHFHKSQRDFLTQMQTDIFDRIDKLFAQLTNLIFAGNTHPTTESDDTTSSNNSPIDYNALLRSLHTLIQLQLLIFPPILKRMGAPDDIANRQHLLARAMAQAHHYSLITEAQQDYIQSHTNPAEPTPENINARSS